MTVSKNKNLEKEMLLNSVFPYPSYEDWKIEAVKLLKGAPFDKIMKTDTCEGITLNGIYNKDDINELPYVDTLPGEFPFVRGNSGVKRVAKGWDVQQEIEVDNIIEWNCRVLESLKRGQNSLKLNANEYLMQNAYEFFQLAFKGILSDRANDCLPKIDIEICNSYLPEFLKYCSDNKIDMMSLKGSFASDPLKYLVKNGYLPYNHDNLFNFVAEAIKNAIELKSPLKSILIDLSIYNDSGSSAVDDLGIMASIVTLYADELQKRGLDINDIFNQMTFVFAVSNNMFMEISKLRAARYIFAKLASAYGVSNENSKMRIHVKTSNYTKTYFDPWVNILRTTTEAFSAIIGGCDSLHVTPFDCVHGEADEFANRIARNQQLVLLEEAHLNAVNDPAGGSYYVEALTNELIKKGWDFFLAIDDNGGFLNSLGSITVAEVADMEKGTINSATIRGFIQVKIDQSHSYRLKNAETRKDNIVGTSVFANLNEKKIEKENKKSLAEKSIPPFAGRTKQAISDKNSLGHTKIEPLPKRRLSETFEDLRQTIENMSPRPEVFVVNIGSTVKNKPRVDFALGFFEPAGFRCSTNDGFATVQEAIEFLFPPTFMGGAGGGQIIILSSTDDQYPTIVPEFAKALKDKAPEKILVLAGYPKDHIETFTQAGVDFYVYMRANVVLTIREILKRVEGK
ncbi:MAG: methylmalonyl-CoA mutase family protein [Candidatus Cloacimonetes bacterium]|nr:methylmalonyl-CoA mutase family protein [Candidatus Cloacimonadota bacterium]